ncbi:MAG: T9SS type A sorting domain-containing protein, partial [Cytophagales bacterium]|nr:T9SS type A sorting domain-containing protein [Cytophagales bacterium]
SKIPNDSSFIYKINRRTKTRVYTTNKISFTTDTLSITYNFNDKKYLNDLRQFNFYYDSALQTWGKKEIQEFNFVNYNKDTCLYFVPYEGTCPTYFQNGLGETQKGCGFYTGGYNHKLVYYKKGSKTWGQRILLSIEDNESSISSSFKISPNPASTNIHYSLANQIKEGELRLLDVLGNVAYSTSLNTTDGNIDVSKLGRGIYFYQISSSSKPVLSGKIVLE